ncbi:hypothetical protein GSI_12928 [Ganoderma sinense ZZ0214-1]|uniref:Shr3 amino acid permease chaperone n=1 Tax=Ganoderma sinense ZZ0214-1 TaxID=1077348 RepID=A0A2G8RU49_9APHY|nr:hypothetical protein GSI_12928 [Ganoderma sinense ZZ0214-1]
MGYRQAAVLVSVSFFLGVLAICLNVDYRILFTTLSDNVVRDGFEFYTTFYNSPPAIKASFLRSLQPSILPSPELLILGLVGLIGKLHKWDESAVFFDGSSLGAFSLHHLGPCPGIPPQLPCPATVAYVPHLPLPTSWMFQTPTAAYIFALAVYMTVGIPACRTVADPVPNVDTKDDQIEALRVLSAGNTIIIVLLGGILALQAGQQWARRLEDNIIAEAATDKTKAAEPEMKAGAAAESKKDK